MPSSNRFLGAHTYTGQAVVYRPIWWLPIFFSMPYSENIQRIFSPDFISHCISPKYQLPDFSRRALYRAAYFRSGNKSFDSSSQCSLQKGKLSRLGQIYDIEPLAKINRLRQIIHILYVVQLISTRYSKNFHNGQ